MLLSRVVASGIAASLLIAATTAPSLLAQEASVVVEVEAGGPALPPAPVAEAVVAVEAAAPAIECCPIQVLREHATLSAKRAYRCYGPGAPQTLCVDNPADNCCKYFAVPVCVPGCCVGEPVCCGSHAGLLGRGHVTYRWPCGFEAVITFRVHGGVLITYK